MGQVRSAAETFGEFALPTSSFVVGFKAGAILRQ